MKFIKTPVKGMRDCLPADLQLREYVMNMIRETYKLYGFSEIETPAIEHIENLTSNQGGENEKLIFKILKRGRDLEKVISNGSEDFADIGLRYDLTLPLARYYANNINSLPMPFKALQIGSVWRADKPQKGRFRQFTQCDIDILGESSVMAEIELIAATSDMLTKIFEQVDIKNFTVHINDRNILKAMAKFAGFDEADYETIFIVLDKYDKIGVSGIKDELSKNGFDEQCIERYTSIFDRITDGITCTELCEFMGDVDNTYASNLDTVISSVKSMISENVNAVFDPTIVRGMSYYTGTIFECTIDGYNFAIAGGGRYDKMIGKFSGMDTCACGFSIGFERIITILTDNIDKLKLAVEKKCAFLVEQGLDSERLTSVFREAQSMRKEGIVVTVQAMKKNIKHQIDVLEEEGYSDIKKIYKS